MKIIVLFISSLVFLFSSISQAADYRHLIDGSLDLANLKTDSDATGETTENKFELLIKYRNQIQPSLYLVSGFQFIDSETIEAFGLEFGVEKNLFSGADGVEIGPGVVATFTNGEYGNQDYRSFGFTPYGFIRSFIGGSAAYIMWTLGYQFAFADRDGVDEDTRGITMSFGFGLGF